MHLWIGIHFHRLSMNVLRPEWATDRLLPAMAVLDNEHVVAMTDHAARLGVRHGMRRRSVQALAPEVLLTRRDPEREAQACTSAALALLQYTPDVAQADEHVVLLDVGASLQAFGGVRALNRRIRHTVGSLGMDASIAMAPTAMGAWLLARQATQKRRRVMTMPTLLARMNGVPCELLPSARPHLAWLRAIGCRTVGGLLRLPRAGLQQRTSPQVLQMLDRICGRAPDLFVWTKAPLEFDRRLPMPERMEQVEVAMRAAEQLVEQLCGWLQARRCAVCSMVLQLEHERGRHGLPPSELRIGLAAPAWRPEHLSRLLRERLSQVVLPAPFLAVRLMADELQPWSVPTAPLFADPANTSGQGRLLELLVARLGRGRVLQPAPVEDHRPEVANAWRPASLAGMPAHSLSGRRERPVSKDIERPFWLLGQPVPLEIREGCLSCFREGSAMFLQPVGGPERIEAGWWSGRLVARDYFIAEDDRHARYWIYRERDSTGMRWFLHGFFA